MKDKQYWDDIFRPAQEPTVYDAEIVPGPQLALPNGPSVFESFLRRVGIGCLGKMLFFVLLLPFFGAYMLWGQWLKEPPRRGQPPTVLTPAELRTTTLGNDAAVVLTDFQFEMESISTNFLATQNEWSNAFIPIRGRYDPAGGATQLLVYTDRAHTRDALEQLQWENRLEGVLVRGDIELSNGESKRLRRHFPNIKVAECITIRHGRKPASLSNYWFTNILATGLVMLAAPMSYGIWRLWKRRQAIMAAR